MKPISILFFFAFLYSSIFAQNPNDAVVIYSGGAMRTMNIQNKKTETEGSFYYNNDWYTGDIELFSGEIIKNYPLKYDMKMQQIDIKVEGGVKFVNAHTVKVISWVHSTGAVEVLKNVSNFKEFNGTGFFSILSEGKVTLLKKTELTLLEANYNAAMDVGAENNKYVKKEKYYILKGNSVQEIKKSKKAISVILSDHISKVDEYVNQYNLNVKEEYDLIKIFDFYNSL